MSNTTPTQGSGLRPVPVRRHLAALLGFVAGLCTLPLALIVWPVMIAVFLYNEEEGEEV